MGRFGRPPRENIHALGLEMRPVDDPADAGAISNTGSGFVRLVSVGAGGETRTLAAPLWEGQLLSLIDYTHVGNIVVTIATLVNQTGNNTLTFGAANDHIILIGTMCSGGTLRWRVLYNDGVDLSSV